MMKNELILVDEQDREIGYDEKINTHRNGSLHRAFSVFLLDTASGKVLLQKRNAGKYHSGGLWSNSCCSHQYKGENILESVNRCMKDELGIGTEQCFSVTEAGTFTYFSDYGELKEHEIDHVFICRADAEGKDILHPDMSEVEAVKWVEPEAIDEQLKAEPERFTSWFSEAYKIARKEMRK